MEILIIKNDSDESKVGDIRIKDLPVGLREMFKEIKKGFSGSKRIIIKDGNIFQEKKKVLKLIAKPSADLIEKIFKAQELLDWYLKPHWRPSGMPDALGSSVKCAECGSPGMSGYREYCLNPGCSSHEKWAKIIGPGYKPPFRMKILKNALMKKKY